MSQRNRYDQTCPKCGHPTLGFDNRMNEYFCARLKACGYILSRFGETL